MKKITLLTLCACCIFTAFSKHVPKAFKKYFVNCCNARKTNIREQLDIGGYFTYQFIYDTVVTNGNIIFYDNGLCVNGWGGNLKPMPSEELDAVNKKGVKSYFYQDCNWGVYELRGDTIITRTIKRASLLQPEALFAETYYRIKDRTTILLIRGRQGKEEDILNFVPYKNLPNPDYSWIKKQKCELCDSPGSPIQTRRK